MIWPIFIVGALCIVLLHLWYFSRKGPLTEKEIQAFMAQLQEAPTTHTETDVLQAFMQNDDGKEICMANFVSLYQEKITHPVTGEQVAPQHAVKDYMKKLLGLGLKKACHPIYLAYRAGGHIDSWGSEEQIDFRGLQMMRYRSRRDFMEIVNNSDLNDGLDIKFAAIEKTISYPAKMQFTTFLRPHLWLSLVILLICCVLQIALTL